MESGSINMTALWALSGEVRCGIEFLSLAPNNLTGDPFMCERLCAPAYEAYFSYLVTTL